MQQDERRVAKKLFWVFLVLLCASVFFSVLCWRQGCRWPVFAVWGGLFFLSFVQGMEGGTKDVKFVFPISLIGLFVTGNILGFKYDVAWALGIVSVMEFFTVILVLIGSLPEK